MRRPVSRSSLLLFSLLVLLPGAAAAQGDFVNWESPHVHPLELTPDGKYLLAVSTADARLLVYGTGGGGLPPVAAIPVGLDPVSVRARTATEAWVVNMVSDSISVVDLTTFRVTHTLDTADEPADVIFAGTPERAFVSCPKADRLQLFDPANPGAVVAEVVIDAEEPRALAVSADGSKVYAAIFTSGNGSTILAGGRVNPNAFPPNVVSDPLGPYAGLNPPPNDGAGWNPPIRAEYLPGGATPAPAVGLIVKKDAANRWLDDNGGDWTPLVSGPQSNRSGRPRNWDVLDRDLAVVDTATLDVTYVPRLMNLVMGLAVRPGDGRVTVVGTDALNEVRFEPLLKGRFLRVRFASVDPAAPGVVTAADLNAGHLTYSDAQVAAQADPATTDPALAARSLGDPRSLLWNPAGTRGYVAGLGSNNVIVINAAGGRLNPLSNPPTGTLEVGEGPTGLAMNTAGTRLYVLNRFGGSISVLDLATEAEVGRVPFFDPTPGPIRSGRRFLYDTRTTSGLGHVSCGSCHVDGRIDRLSWDLGDPAGEVRVLDPLQQNLGLGAPGAGAFQDFHPMKGPMMTQTLVDIIGKEPHHWRGDKLGIEEFNPAFRGLLGNSRSLTPAEMQQFEDFLATLAFPPNPHRNMDNSLPTVLPLPGHRATGRFAGQGGLPPGTPLPAGNAVNGLLIFRPPRLLDGGNRACSSCHTLPTGAGADVTRSGGLFVPFPVGPGGEHHLGLVATDGSTNATMKTVQLRGLEDKVGLDFTQVTNRAGFGFSHDGSQDSLARFISGFQVTSDQEVADLVALMLAFSGSDLPGGSIVVADQEPPGPPALDTHAAVGRQVTVRANTPDVAAVVASFQALADAGAVGLVAKGSFGGLSRGWSYVGGGLLQSDRAAEVTALSVVLASAAPGSEITFTVVPAGTQGRLGIDRDGDGAFDRDEVDTCGDPADPAVQAAPGGCNLFGDGFEAGGTAAWSVVVTGG